MTDRAGPEDNVVKFTEIFLRRAAFGQCFHRPYLGTREFAAEFALIRGDEPAPVRIDENRDLGWMLLDILHDSADDEGPAHSCGPACAPRFFNAALVNGALVEKGKDRLPDLRDAGVRG